MKKQVFETFVAIWVGVMVLLGGYYLFFAEREGSFEESENRALASAPEISVSSIFGGEWSESVENFLADHVPARNLAISISRSIREKLSFASYEDSLVTMTRTDDALSNSQLSQQDIESMASELLNNTPTQTPPPAETPEVSAPIETEEPEPTPEPTPEPVKNPPKPQADEADFPDTFPVHLAYDGQEYNYYNYGKANILALTSVLNRVAALLPEDGTLVFTMVPQSSLGTRFANATDKVDYSCQAETVVEAFGADNVHAVSAANILGDAMKNGEYVYFRTDMHWTPRGTYLVYREMAALAGIEPAEWEDYDIQTESPFRGTYYRDNPTDYMYNNPDDLDLLTPKFDLEWRRITSPDDYTLIPFLKFDAIYNDRYTVYLGGPAGPWTYAECDNGKEDNCLVITDSFGLAFVPLVTQNYKQVHYCDPRFFNVYTTGASVSEMMDKYDIKDVYVVVGDLHSYSSDFIISQLSYELGDR